MLVEMDEFCLSFGRASQSRASAVSATALNGRDTQNLAIKYPESSERTLGNGWSGRNPLHTGLAAGGHSLLLMLSGGCCSQPARPVSVRYPWARRRSIMDGAQCMGCVLQASGPGRWLCSGSGAMEALAMNAVGGNAELFAM